MAKLAIGLEIQVAIERNTRCQCKSASQLSSRFVLQKLRFEMLPICDLYDKYLIKYIFLHF